MGDEKICNLFQSKSILTVSNKLRIFQRMAECLNLNFDRIFLKTHLLELASDNEEFINLLLTLSEKKVPIP
jgi:hypothetical protein